MQLTHPTLDRRIRAGLLLFWALYFSVVCLSNSTDALKALQLLPPDFRFVSGNYGMVSKVVGIYSPPGWFAALLFAGVIVWEGLGAILFWKAFTGTVRQTTTSSILARLALGSTIGLWAMFIVADEVFLAYELPGLSSTFFSLLIAELASLIVLRQMDH